MGCAASPACFCFAVPSRTGTGGATLGATSWASAATGGGIMPSDRRPARVRIASIRCVRNGLPSTAISASGLRSKASRERANRTDSRPWKWARSAGGSFSSRRSTPLSSSLTAASSQ